MELGKDFAVLGFSPTAKAKGRLAFAGYGITAPELKYDDYAGLDVQGKLVVVLRHTPRAGNVPRSARSGFKVRTCSSDATSTR